LATPATVDREGRSEDVAAASWWKGTVYREGREGLVETQRLEKVGWGGSAVFGGSLDPSFLGNIPCWWIIPSTQFTTKRR
jgi:hypothetical protein